nr:DUF3164 family protein [uncultured Bacteroides sp.]
MDIKNFTPEEKAELKKQLDAEEREQVKKVEDDRSTYKNLKEEFVLRNFTILESLSRQMQEVKQRIFQDSEVLVNMKNALFNVKGNRQTDTFTSESGKYSIKLGNRTYEGWDDSVEIGIEKVQNFIRSMAKDDNSAALVDTVMRLLAKDRKGSLKANKVIELEQLALKTQNPEFLEGIKIIKDAYRPSPSCTFIEVRYKDENGKEKTLPLSISSIE